MLLYINDFLIEFCDYIVSEIILWYVGFDKVYCVDYVLKVIVESFNLF